MGLGVLVDRDKKQVTYSLVIRGETGWLANEMADLAGLLKQHGELGHVVLAAGVTHVPDRVYDLDLVITVSDLLPEDVAWLEKRARIAEATAQLTQMPAPRSLKRGDRVRMVRCGEAEQFGDRIWVCATDEFESGHSLVQRLVGLEGFSGTFLAECLELVDA
ncbi:MAG: hypothetical protein M1272_07880 [Firmicutes bacterium]|nr:hypothetical protein [Bacillota bacterium]